MPKQDKPVDMSQTVAPETVEQRNERLFSELNQLANPLYNWLAENFTENTSVEVRKGKITIKHDLMVLTVVDEEENADGTEN